MITILTPTYNRAYILPNLYKSLQNQTCTNFEWIIIDDGSNDNSEQLVKSWIKDNNVFKISYIKKENGGKHRAINYAIDMVQTEFCFIVDSDDYLTISAIQFINEWVYTIRDNFSFAGVSGLRGYSNNKRIGEYPKSKKFHKYIDATNLQRYKFDLGGDKAEIYRTEILKKYPFPEFKGENFLPEDVVWNAIARDGYIIRWFNEIIYICEYLDDGLTRMGTKKFLRNFEGYTYAMRQRVELQGTWQNLLSIGVYVNIGSNNGLKIRDSSQKLGISTAKIWIACLIWQTKNIVKIIIEFTKCKLNVNGVN